MIKYFKNTLIILCLLLNFQTLSAQLGLTFSEVIKNNGADFTSGAADGGFKYITYGKKKTTNASGSFEQRTVYYFADFASSKELKCWLIKLISPTTEYANYVSAFNKVYTNIGVDEWKDNETNTIISVEISNGFCTVSIVYDGRVDKLYP